MIESGGDNLAHCGGLKSMSISLNRRLRNRVDSSLDPMLLPGAPNALTARVLEDEGFEAIYVSGAGVTNTFLGAPDIGLLTLTEMAAHVQAIRDAVDVPLVVDADTGFGNALNVRRTVQVLERAGANAIQLEDQITPKRCGHFDRKSVISTEEMIGKINAATDARVDDDLIIIARTDAAAEHGIEAACERARQYLEAGADAAFVEAPTSVEELAMIPRLVPGIHVANMVEDGQTPVLPLAELGRLGFTIVLYANTTMRAAIASMRRVAAGLHASGDSRGIHDEIASWADRQNLVRFSSFEQLGEKYGVL